MSANAWRYVGAIGLGVVGGTIAYFTDNTHWTGWFDLCRHMALGVGIALPSLHLTLTPKA